jgi:nitroimidazol reductase NimA-like FMN-containing flavoprotein (pyridoxamine 5'-phosphate oxidase superfamily)
MSTSYNEVLEPDECRRLLASKAVARIGFVGAGKDILVLPVSYVVDLEGVLVFSTSRKSVLAHLQHGERVSVQVDDVSEELHNGWSVLAHGHAPGSRTTTRCASASRSTGSRAGRSPRSADLRSSDLGRARGLCARLPTGPLR